MRAGEHVKGVDGRVLNTKDTKPSIVLGMSSRFAPKLHLLALIASLSERLSAVAARGRTMMAGGGRRNLGSIDEPLGSNNGFPPWVIALLVLLIVAAIILLALYFLVPPAPPPYT